MTIKDLSKVLTLPYGDCYINEKLSEMNEENENEEILYMHVEKNGVVYITTNKE